MSDRPSENKIVIQSDNASWNADIPKDWKLINKRSDLDAEMKRYLMAKRQTLIMELGALEDLLGIERSIIPRHKR